MDMDTATSIMLPIFQYYEMEETTWPRARDCVRLFSFFGVDAETKNQNPLQPFLAYKWWDLNSHYFDNSVIALQS